MGFYFYFCLFGGNFVGNDDKDYEIVENYKKNFYAGSIKLLLRIADDLEFSD